MKKTLKMILVPVLLCAFVYSGWQVWRICGAYARAEEQYDALAEYVSLPSLPDVPTVPVVPDDGGAEESTAPMEVPWPEVDFESLRGINEEIVGWLTIEGTRVHYPVVRGTDNDYYLNHRFDGKKSGGGCLFLDAGNSADFSDANQIIYGHYMKDHSMFYDLGGFKRQEFFDAHPTGWLITPETVYRVRFFSGYVSDTDEDAWKREFSEEEYGAWLEMLLKKSRFSSDVAPVETDRILTLSTCSYEFEDARFVLHGVLEEQICK